MAEVPAMPPRPRKMRRVPPSAFAKGAPVAEVFGMLVTAPVPDVGVAVGDAVGAAVSPGRGTITPGLLPVVPGGAPGGALVTGRLSLPWNSPQPARVPMGGADCPLTLLM